MTDMFKEVEMEFEDELVLDRLDVEDEIELTEEESCEMAGSPSSYQSKLPFNRNRLGPPSLIPNVRKLPNSEFIFLY